LIVVLIPVRPTDHVFFHVKMFFKLLFFENAFFRDKIFFGKFQFVGKIMLFFRYKTANFIFEKQFVTKYFILF